MMTGKQFFDELVIPLEQVLRSALHSAPAAAAVEAMQSEAPFSAHCSAGRQVWPRNVHLRCAALKGLLQIGFAPP